MNMHSRRLATVRERISSAANACGRNPDEVRLLAVSKQHSAESVAAMHELGQMEFGENRVEEGCKKQDELLTLPLCWHFIGPIQSNKTARIAERFAWVQSVDRAKILQRLSDQRPASLPPLNVCLQVNIDDEPQKAGAGIDEVATLAAMATDLPRLRLRGLMCIPSRTDEHQRTRDSFLRMAALTESLREDGYELDTLSMGMSGDLDLAIACGSTMVRIGTDLFGARAPVAPPSGEAK